MKIFQKLKAALSYLQFLFPQRDTNVCSQTTLATPLSGCSINWIVAARLIIIYTVTTVITIYTVTLLVITPLLTILLLNPSLQGPGERLKRAVLVSFCYEISPNALSYNLVSL